MFFSKTLQNYNIKPPKHVVVKKKMQKICVFWGKMPFFSLFFHFFALFFAILLILTASRRTFAASNMKNSNYD